MQPVPSAGKHVRARHDRFGLLLIGWEYGACFVNQSRSVVKQNQSNYAIVLRRSHYDKMAASFDLFRMHLHRQPNTNTKLDLRSPSVDRDYDN